MFSYLKSLTSTKSNLKFNKTHFQPKTTIKLNVKLTSFPCPIPGRARTHTRDDLGLELTPNLVCWRPMINQVTFPTITSHHDIQDDIWDALKTQIRILNKICNCKCGLTFPQKSKQFVMTTFIDYPDPSPPGEAQKIDLPIMSLFKRNPCEMT